MSDQEINCYLCGKQIREDTNLDHIPPKQFFGTEVRKTLNPNLITLPTHRTCNSSFQLDEDYFVTSLTPLISESESGRSVYNDVRRRFDEGKKVGLVHKVYEEFDENPSGLILPRGKVLKRFEGQRIRRVVWKITRGLYFIENSLILPEETDFRILYTFPGEEPHKIINLFTASDLNGKYPGVFDYAYKKNTVENITGNVWALLFWDQIMTMILFHDVTCRCQDCILKKDEKAKY